MPEIAATLGFAGGLLVGYAIAQIRAAQASASSKVFTRHGTRDTKHGF